MPRLLKRTEMAKIAMLKQADQEGRKQAQIDHVLALAKFAGQIQARVALPALMEKQALSAAPIKAVGSKAIAGVRNLLSRGTKKAVTEGAEKGVTREVGQVARPHWSPPPQVAGPAVTPGRARPAIQPHQRIAAPSIVQRAEAEMQSPLALQSHGATPPAPRRSIENVTKHLNPAQQAEIALNKTPGNLQLSHSEVAPVSQVAPQSAAWRSTAPPPIPGRQHPAIQPHQGIPAARPGQGVKKAPVVIEGRAGSLGAPEYSAAAPEQALQEARTVRESAQAGLQAPTQSGLQPAPKHGDKGPVNRSQAKREAAIAARTPEEQAAITKNETAKKYERVKELQGISEADRTPEQETELQQHLQNKDVANLSGADAQKARMRRLKWGLGAAVGLPALALGYGALKAAPAVAGTLNQSTMYPMAGAYGWSPVDYGYGSNPYGPGALNLGPGA